jgi:DNA-directed RNA polymerase specialized sigma24 family protein
VHFSQRSLAGLAMHPQAVGKCGETASSCPPTDRTPAEVKAGCEDATAAQGLFAEPASELLASHGHTLGRGRRGSGSATADSVDQAERRLVVAIFAGSRSALRRLYMLYFPRLARFFTHLTPMSATDVVEDLITGTMFDVWRKSVTFERTRSVHVSIMRLAYAHGSKRLAEGDQLRSSPELLRRGLDCDASFSGGPKAPLPVLEVLGSLRVAERAVVHLVHSGHSRQEVADILSIPDESVDTHLASSMSALRPWLASRFGLGSNASTGSDNAGVPAFPTGGSPLVES